MAHGTEGGVGEPRADANARRRGGDGEFLMRRVLLAVVVSVGGVVGCNGIFVLASVSTATIAFGGPTAPIQCPATKTAVFVARLSQ